MRRDLRTLLFVLTMLVMLALVAVILFGCSHPLRLDQQRQDLERRQNECLARGGNPKDCRP